MTSVSILIVNWNAADVLRDCLDSVYRTVKNPFEVIVVDNHSLDNSAAMIKAEYPQVILSEQRENKGFSAGNNIGFESCKGKYVLILNPDTVVLENSVDLMVDLLEKRPDIGIVGPKLFNKANVIESNAKRKFPGLFRDFLKIFLFSKVTDAVKRRAFYSDFEVSGKCECLAGCCMLMKSQTYRQLSGFDENVPMYLDDIDLCFRARRLKLDNYYLADARVIHLGGHSTKKTSEYKIYYDMLGIRAHLEFYRKHFGARRVLFLKAIIALSIPYLLILDVLLFPYFLSRNRLEQGRLYFRKHLKYLSLLNDHHKIALIK